MNTQYLLMILFSISFISFTYKTMKSIKENGLSSYAEHTWSLYLLMGMITFLYCILTFIIGTTPMIEASLNSLISISILLLLLHYSIALYRMHKLSSNKVYYRSRLFISIILLIICTIIFILYLSMFLKG